MKSKEVIISVRSLCKDYPKPNGGVFPVIENINIDIYDGEFLAIVGLSGSGKSTLMRCMAGLTIADRGTVTHKEPSKDNLHFCSFVFQNFALFPWLNVKENICISILNLPKYQQKKRVEHILKLVGLKGFEECYPKELSGGMRQRVSLARAIVCDPMLLFMDEPFSALDPLTNESLRIEITKLWSRIEKKTRACVLVTHKFDEALQIADRIIIMSSNPGRIFKIIEIDIPLPRNPLSKEYKEAESYLKKTFSDMHLSNGFEMNGPQFSTKISSSKINTIALAGITTNLPESTSGLIPVPNKVVSLANLSFNLIEGLLSLLDNHKDYVEINELCEEMGQSINRIIPVIKAAHDLNFISIKGNKITLTEEGKQLAKEDFEEKHYELIQSSLLKVPIVNKIYKKLEESTKNNEDGLHGDDIMKIISEELPFEDTKNQQKALIKWGRYCNLFKYDSLKDLFYLN